MISMQRTPFGFKLVFSGTVDSAEIDRWGADAQRQLASAPASFGVVVDMTSLKPMAPDAAEKLAKGQEGFRARGMKRSAVGMPSAILTIQAQRVAKQSGIATGERHINAAKVPDWEAKAVAWVKDGVEP